MIGLAPGIRATVSVPATSANLGPGFDCLGLALDLRDDYDVVVTRSGRVEVRSSGECADDLPGDESHLVARALSQGLRDAGFAAPGLDLRCHNRIPQGRGLGSSAAAIVGGLALATALTGSSEGLVAAAADLEGHPDNVAAAALGGLTVSWIDDGGTARATSLPVSPEIDLVLYIPEATSPTHEARAALPATVPHADAAFNAARSALLVTALAGRPDLLLEATRDRLHQEQRRDAYPQAMALVDRLRGQDVAAVISGAGPAVLAMGARGTVAPSSLPAVAGFTATQVGIGPGAVPTRISAARSS